MPAAASPPTTRQRILDLISRGPATVQQLSAALGVTRNAVVVQLRHLVEDALVRRGGHQRTGAAGKPGFVYELMPGNEDARSEAYRPLVGQMLAVLKERLEPREMAAVMEEAGARLAHEAGLVSGAVPRERLAKAVAVVNRLGACAQIVEGTAGELIVENHRCPFAHAVRRDACVCHAAAAFFRAATGLPFEQKCDRAQALTCRYVASLPARAKRNRPQRAAATARRAPSSALKRQTRRPGSSTKRNDHGARTKRR